MPEMNGIEIAKMIVEELGKVESLIKFVKDRLVGKKDQLVLKKWDPLWQLNRLYFNN